MEKEWQFFLCSVLYGAQVLIVYDLIRSIRGTWQHGKILIAIGDLLFWTVIGIFLFTRLYLWNYGILRWYFFTGIFLGMLLYAAGISPWVVKFVSFFLKRLKLFFSWVKLLVKGAISKAKRILRIKNGENVKTEKEKTACEGADAAE